MTKIVVGADGSVVSLHAVNWAAREAVLRGMSLRIVHAVRPWLYEMPEDSPHGQVGRWVRKDASTMLQTAADHASREAPDVRVDVQLLPGDARPVLLKEAEGAAMLVVGGRGEGGFAGMVLGSVAHAVVGRPRCPVVVVQGPQIDGTGEIVVGVDGSPKSRAALAFALTEASIRHTQLRVVHAWRRPAWLIGDTWFRDRSDLAEVQLDEAHTGEMLASVVSAASAGYPHVKVVEELDEGHPVHVLAQASSLADLLVVGHRGLGGFSRLRLGSVSRGVLHHAQCPVMIVPS